VTEAELDAGGRRNGGFGAIGLAIKIYLALQARDGRDQADELQLTAKKGGR
jgi:hypothetical protein